VYFYPNTKVWHSQFDWGVWPIILVMLKCRLYNIQCIMESSRLYEVRPTQLIFTKGTSILSSNQTIVLKAIAPCCELIDSICRKRFGDGPPSDHGIRQLHTASRLLYNFVFSILSWKKEEKGINANLKAFLDDHNWREVAHGCSSQQQNHWQDQLAILLCDMKSCFTVSPTHVEQQDLMGVKHTRNYTQKDLQNCKDIKRKCCTQVVITW
jgi:hypothetical protein